MSIYQTRLEFQLPLDPYALHQVLWRAFPAVPRGGKQPFLFRADVLPVDARLVTRVLLRSGIMPVLTGLGESARILSEPSLFSTEAEQGQILRFLLRANPTRAAKATHHAIRDLRGDAFRELRGKRVGIFGEPARQVWLERRGASHGFALVRVPGPNGDLPALAQTRPTLVRWMKNARGVEQRARHDGIDFEGLLRVEDPGAFAGALIDGIGAAKGLGFGLLSVKAP